MKNAQFCFVGCPNLGYEGFEIIRRYIPNAVSYIWKRGDKAGKESIKRDIISNPQSVLFSFYNDYIFEPEELSKFRLAVNIHPSLERGRGYDTIPLIENHSTHGIMLHYVTEAIDAGNIIQVKEQKIPEGINYTNFRRVNQALCLKMLEDFAKRFVNTLCIEELEDGLANEAEKLSRSWGDRYISANYLGRTLRTLRQSEPDHRVFQVLPEEIIQYDSTRTTKEIQVA